MKELYSNVVVESAPRLLCMVDTNPYSQTYGCFDRLYWHYKSTDFANARFQEAVLTLALLYKNKYDSVYNNQKILDMAVSALDFWTRIQRKNGSFDEAYPNENSFVATAFTTYAATEAFMLIEDEIPEDLERKLLAAFRKAGEWLSENNDFDAINQTCGALAALYNVYKITKEERFLTAVKEKLKIIKDKQNREGWFPEYGGPDFGYLSVAIDYLAKYYRASGDENIIPIATDAIDFFNYFVYDDGTVGGVYGSRNTEYIIPSGFEVFSEKVPAAREVCYKIIQGLKNKTIITPQAMDDRYFVFNSYTYLQAHDNYNKNKNKPSEIFEKRFPESRLVVIKNKNYFVVIGFNKGGVFRFHSKNYTYSDAGFVGKTKSGDNVCTQWLDYNYSIKELSVSGKFHKFDGFLMTPTKTAASRVLLSFGGGKALKSQARKKMIKDSPITDLKFKRSFVIEENNFQVFDTVEGSDLEKMELADKMSFIHVASSRYFQKQDLSFSNDNTDIADLINEKGFAEMRRSLGEK
ncbi:MAG: hypothetical protein ABIF08_00675 [Nanoarchaeota archaeon]